MVSDLVYKSQMSSEGELKLCEIQMPYEWTWVKLNTPDVKRRGHNNNVITTAKDLSLHVIQFETRLQNIFVCCWPTHT